MINDSNLFYVDVSISYLIFELEVTARPLLGDEQQVVEEEEVPLLALQTLKQETRNSLETRHSATLEGRSGGRVSTHFDAPSIMAR